MDLQGERVIPASIEATWAALNDPEVLKACIAGCESMKRTGDDTMAAVVALKIGPVSARFEGKVETANVQAPTGCTLDFDFDGQGGAAGFGKGSADVTLSPRGDAATLLTYHARAAVGGNLAQIGSHLIDATAAKLTEDFFKTLEARLAPAAAKAVPLPGATEGAVFTNAAAAVVTPPHEPSGGDPQIAKLWWLIGAVVVLAIVYFAIR